MQRIISVLSYTVLLLLCLGGLSAQAATFYVKIQGNDATPCAQAKNAQTPRRTLNAGIACLQSGDTLIVGAGTYDELITDYAGVNGYTVPVPSGSSWASATTLKAESPGSVILTASRSFPNGNAIVLLEQSRYIIIDGFVIDAKYNPGHAYGASIGGHHIRLANTEIKNLTSQGVIVGGSFNEFLNVHIHHTGYDANGVNVCKGCDGQTHCPGYCHGYYCQGTNHLIEGGSIHDVDGHGIQFYAGSPRDSVMRNVLIYNAQVGIGIYGPNHQIYNNVLVNNQIHIVAVSSGNVIAHNTIYGWAGLSSPDNFGIYDKGSGTVIKNNLILNQKVSVLREYIFKEGGTGSSGNAYVNDIDPALVAGNICDNTTMVGCTSMPATARILMNASGGDFHLCAGSPAIAAGVPVPEVAVDKEGRSRPHTGAVDVGAYQYAAQGPVVPAPQRLRAVVR